LFNVHKKGKALPLLLVQFRREDGAGWNHLMGTMRVTLSNSCLTDMAGWAYLL